MEKPLHTICKELITANKSPLKISLPITVSHNNTAAEMIAMQKMSSTIFPTRTAPEERYRQKARNQKDIAITNHHKRYSNINQSPIKIEFFWGGAPLSAP